jgi:hypothetical protein
MIGSGSASGFFRGLIRICIKWIRNTVIKDSWTEQVMREESVALGGNALEAANSHSKRREQRQLDLQTICLDIDIITPSQ